MSPAAGSSGRRAGSSCDHAIVAISTRFFRRQGRTQPATVSFQILANLTSPLNISAMPLPQNARKKGSLLDPYWGGAEGPTPSHGSGFWRFLQEPPLFSCRRGGLAHIMGRFFVRRAGLRPTPLYLGVRGGPLVSFRVRCLRRGLLFSDSWSFYYWYWGSSRVFLEERAFVPVGVWPATRSSGYGNTEPNSEGRLLWTGSLQH